MLKCRKVTTAGELHTGSTTTLGICKATWQLVQACSEHCKAQSRRMHMCKKLINAGELQSHLAAGASAL